MLRKKEKEKRKKPDWWKMAFWPVLVKVACHNEKKREGGCSPITTPLRRVHVGNNENEIAHTVCSNLTYIVCRFLIRIQYSKIEIQNGNSSSSQYLAKTLAIEVTFLPLNRRIPLLRLSSLSLIYQV